MAIDHAPTPGKAKSPRVIDYVRTPFSIAFTFLLLIAAALFTLIVIPLSFGRLQNFVVEKMGGMIGSLVLWANGIRLHVKGSMDAGKPVVYISNHTSTLDMFIILALRLPRTRYVAKYEFLYNPIFFILGRLSGQIFIKRQTSEHAIRTMQSAYERIRASNFSVFLAPEGTRKHEGLVGPFKKGAFRIALDLGFDIVPLFISGARELCPGGSLVVRPGTIEVTVHDLIPAGAWRLEDLDAHIDGVRQNYIEWEQERGAAPA